MSNRTKVAYLADLAAESTAPFLTLTETHFTPDMKSAEVAILGYTLYRSDRLGGRSHGGCASYVRDDLTAVEKRKYSNNCCESQILEIKEMDLLLINIYRPPSATKQLFQEVLEKCQQAIDEVLENEKNRTLTLLAVGDYNFPFIQWPSRRIYTRDVDPAQMASEKQQAQLLLDWADTNFLEQFVLTATRKDNILDLIFSNSNSLINSYSTIINSTFWDHNILKINLNYGYKNEEKSTRKNPYPNKIYEYDLMNASEEDWKRYDTLLTKLSEDFDENTKEEDTEERLNRFYKLIEEAVVTLFEKKEAFKTEENKNMRKRNKISKTARILMRKKSNISKKILASNSKDKTLKLMKALEVVEKELEQSYKNMKVTKEKEALDKIKRNPKFFYSYANKFSKTKSRVGPLANEKGELVKDPYLMAQLLRKQYESTYIQSTWRD